MDDFLSYRTRVSKLGDSVSNSVENHTIDFVNDKFEDSPSYRDAILEDNSHIDVRVTDGRNTEERKVLLRPLSNLSIGSVMSFDNFKWFVFEADTDKIYPKLIVRKCNAYIAVKDSSNVTHNFNCVATNLNYLRYDIGKNNMDVKLLEGGVYLYIAWNEQSKKIKFNQRIIIGNQVYQVSGIDDITNTVNGIGFAKITTSITTINPKDNFVNGIADNSHLANNIENNGGGLVW